MLYRVELFNVGVNSFLIFNVVIFDNIDVSVSSIAFDTFEYLNMLSNFCKFDELKFVKVVNTFDLIVSDVLVVAFESNLTWLVNKTDVVSGSTISGVTEATLNFLSCVTKSNLVALVNVEPEAALIEIFTVPYTGVSSSSPPHAETAWALGYNSKTFVS